MEVSAEQSKVVTGTPENSEAPLECTRSCLTPNRLYFVRNHFDVPVIDMSIWRLPMELCHTAVAKGFNGPAGNAHALQEFSCQT